MIELVKEKYPELENIFELGCHRGADCLSIRNLWNYSIIHAFEADPFNFKIAEEKLKNDILINVVNKAVTNYTGKTQFYRYDNVESIPDKQTFYDKNAQRTGQGSIFELGEGMKEFFNVKGIFQNFEIDCISLYDYCKQNRIKKIDAIFMDVQGAEFNCLLGAKELLKETKAILFEWSNHKIMYRGETGYDGIKLYLESFGFYEYKKEYQHYDYSGDSLFFKKEKRKWWNFAR